MSMRSRLESIKDWESLARKARYRVGKLSRLVGYGVSQVSRHFHRVYGQSPKVWMEWLRLADGAGVMVKGKRARQAVKRIGIKHATNFSRTCKRMLGRTMRELGAKEVKRLALKRLKTKR